MGVVRGVVAFRWGFSGSHMRCSMKPLRSEGRLMRATPCLMASSATAVATCRRIQGLTGCPTIESSPKWSMDSLFCRGSRDKAEPLENHSKEAGLIGGAADRLIIDWWHICFPEDYRADLR